MSTRERPATIAACWPPAAWHLLMAGERDEAARILTDLVGVLPETPFAVWGSSSSFFLAALDGRDEAAIHVTSQLEEAAHSNEYAAWPSPRLSRCCDARRTLSGGCVSPSRADSSTIPFSLSAILPGVRSR